MTTPLILLTAARALISNKEAWTIKAFGRDMYDNQVKTSDASVCKFCSIGALDKVQKDHNGRLRNPNAERIAIQFLTAAAVQLMGREPQTGYRPCTVPDYNDTHTHAEVLAMYDLAIVMANPEKQNAVANR